MEIDIKGNPWFSSQFTEIEVKGIHRERLTGENHEVLGALFGLVSSLDPDVILMPDADTWMPKIRTLAKQYDLVMPLWLKEGTGRWTPRWYWSYGRMEHKESALIPGTGAS